ncbi:YfcC family protein [Cellulomonas endometrii]|uniref:YfcC family protein n=1 Tax=Cellulomonas endometrii TaxID=3036301 RepID=UPI0024AD2E35|nr:YfcC family protein [Cellulomonas endometrii]
MTQTAPPATADDTTTTPPRRRRFTLPNTYTILLGLSVVVWALGFVIPSGQYDVVDGATVPGSYHHVDTAATFGERLMDLFQAPVNGLYGVESATSGAVGPNEQGGLFGAAGVFLFVLAIGAFIVTTTRTGAIDAGIGRVAGRFRGRGALVIVALMVLITLGGSTFGLGEETLGFYAILVPLLLSLGFDRMTAVGVVLVGSVVGNMASTVNPFMVGAASDAAGIPIGQGIGLRALMLVVLGGLAIAYVVRYSVRVRRDPSRSVVGISQEDAEVAAGLDEHALSMTGRQKVVMALFAATFVFMVFALVPWAQVISGPEAASYAWQLDWYFPELTALFLVMSIAVGLVGRMRGEALVQSVLAGASEFLGAALVIVLARGITVIMHNAVITDTVLHSLEDAVQGAGSGLFGILVFLVNIPMSFLVPSSSGLATLSMPVLAPLADFAGVGRDLVVTAFQCAVGVVALVTPTSAIVMGGLSLAKVPYGRYIRWVLPLVAILVAGSFAFLLIGAAL